VATTTTPSGACPAGACVTLDATHPIGPVTHAGSGINQGVEPSINDAADLRALATTMYRSAPPLRPDGSYNWTNWDIASSTGAQTTLVLSDMWTLTDSNGYRVTPWSNWSEYASWVRSTTANILASGRTVDYWDVYNEPGWHNYYSPADFAAETPDDLLQQFLVAYQAIKSVDPTAAIIGPSIGLWALHPLPPNTLTHEPDLTTFLDFAAAHGLQLAAVTWHDNGQTLADLNADFITTWALVRSLPGLGQPKMFLDEYGTPGNQPIPGWDVGYLAAITDAGISSASRSCWETCDAPDLDGLLTDNGQSTTSEYYIGLTYAQMSGQMVATSSSNNTMQALGSIDSSKRQMVALVGRAVAPSASNPAPPTSVRVNLVVPWNSPRVNVALSYEPSQPGAAVSGPIRTSPSNLTTQPDGAGNELVSFSIPNFADGAAYNVVATPSQ
jgi:hypothetical protein